jgi:hypothetical protein
MSQSKWTPGPWYVDTDCQEEILTKAGNLVATAYHNRPQVNENVSLIVAAPEMAEALRALIASLEWEKKRSGTTYVGFENAKAALAKAEGRNLD